MNSQMTSFLFTILLGFISACIGLILYRFGEAVIKYKGARFGGAVAIAGVSFYLMAEFYFRGLSVEDLVREEALEELQESIYEYDTCIAHEDGKEYMACRFQADAVRDAAKRLLP
ncbi:MAG: hypothetical protein ABW104_18095 [Candidatus Thiodiazotropha sp. 6PLUC2]|nr:hypothetical protein [Candidatus Thiodiazotropha lotti]MCW4218793.1 hypothetical protein [Candidatus Thiodiazotropha lotti]